MSPKTIRYSFTVFARTTGVTGRIQDLAIVITQIVTKGSSQTVRQSYLNRNFSDSRYFLPQILRYGYARKRTLERASLLDDTRKELEALKLLVDKVEDPKKNGPKFLKRAQLVVTGFNSQLKARSQRIGHFVNLLQVYLTESAAQEGLETEVRKSLKASTSTTDFVPEKLHGTLEWIWMHDKFIRWTGSTAVPEAGGSSLAQATERAPDIDERVLVLYGVNGQEIYIIIDGIDESSDDWNNLRDGPLSGISKLLESISQLRVLLSGRQTSLRMARRSWPLHIELTPEVIKDEISKFIQHELDNCPEIHDKDIKDCIQAELESKSIVMFLWVKLHVVEEGVVDACGDVITLRGELVYLRHTSLREFLIRQPDEIDHDGAPTAKYFRLEARSCQNVMAMTCLRYLQNISWRGPSEEHYRAKDIEMLFPSLGYATPYLASHFLNSSSEEAFSWLEFVMSMENDETR
ncbi:hypothetical protein B0H63DRAFT_515398 [Podospora didyma]|uniref:Uncharacterized protein n=1 Tax=Podospora didyma TaxID=330526 RepID=A0AAE0N2B5_9PEZI|nr:hypothetical protein B0H63DRAFT_515398 [Podospora didyma]